MPPAKRTTATKTAKQAKPSGDGRQLRIEHVAPGTLVPAPYNPRTMTDDARARLRRGIERFGLVDPIVARRSDRLVIGGHQRLHVAKELGLERVPVVFLDDLADDEAAALNVLLNNPAAQGAWDMARLSDVLSELDANGFDATLTGFDDAALADILTWTPEPEPLSPETAFGALTQGDEPMIQQMTFILHRDQADVVRQALARAAAAGPFGETGNDNAQGNALARIAEAALGVFR